MRHILAVALLALGMLLAPVGASAQTTVELIAADIDAWWAAVFAERGLAYSSPRLDQVDEPGIEFCAGIDVFYTPAGYCFTNNTVFFSTLFASPDSLVWLPVISHEWVHHIQGLADTGVGSLLESELQADCFSGAFVAAAADADWISPVIASQALQLTQSAGDVWFELPFEEQVHGNKAERALAFMTGMNGGLAACGI